MIKALFLFPCFILILLKFEYCIASQLVGAEITYTCTGGNNYRFYLSLFRNCEGAFVDSSYTISGTSTCGDSVIFTVSMDSAKEIQYVCSLEVSKCVNPNSAYKGIEVNFFHGDISLPSVCNYWTFGISPPLCNRNGATNLYPNGSSYCLYVKATVNNSIPDLNSSPVFRNFPNFFLIANNYQFASQYAFDPDGDSLAYQMISAHSDELNDVQYNPGLSSTQPVTYTPPDSTRFSTESGQIRFIANAPQTAVVAIQINEYRNNVLIGSVERDIEYVFSNSINSAPFLSGINGSLSYTIHVCADSLLSFKIKSIDYDANQQTWIAWSDEIPTADFSTSGTYRDTGYVSWQPSLGDFRSLPYFVVATVSDSTCPVPGINSYYYKIYVDSCIAHDGISENEYYDIRFSGHYNSSNHSIQFYYKLAEPLAVTISLYDIMGRKMKYVTSEKLPEANMVMDVQEIRGGLYILNLKLRNGISKSIKIAIE